MKLTKIRLTNFKSFDELDINLQNFNLIIGANASGKSNFIRIFEFLRDTARYGLENSISMQGGISYLRNVNIGASKDFSLEATFDYFDSTPFKIKRGDYIGLKTNQAVYKFTIKFNKKGQGYKIIDDRLIIKYDLFKLEWEKGRRVLKDKELLGKDELVVARPKGKVSYTTTSDKFKDISNKHFLPRVPQKEKVKDKALLLESSFYRVPFDVIELRNMFTCSIYDFDPKLPKKSTPITGRIVFEEDGSNVALIIKEIIKQKESKRKFLNLIKDILPFIEELKIEKFADKSMIIKLMEKYYQSSYLPAPFISDGTLNVVSLIIALYFDRRPLAIIEEPERNIHPHLISKVVAMMKDASRSKQLIVTTHNPEMVKYAGLDNILFVSRNREGVSVISKPTDFDNIQSFLQNEIGLDEIFVKNLRSL